MHVTVFGATGGTGRHVVAQALRAGHRVQAVVRDPGRLPLSHVRLETVRMDTPDLGRLAQTLAHGDAVISALGASARGGFPASTWISAILRAVEDHPRPRLVAVSASPLGPPPARESMVIKKVVTPLVGWVFRDAYRDLAVMERSLSASDTDWTILRPPRLTDGPLTGLHRMSLGTNVSGGLSISRADLAHAALAALEDPATLKQAVGVSR
ncbi:NAD(P)H-binding protein [Nocardiopsis dassonvillei subsp. albirubida]|uniref:NAD(P)H-binding protein n=1 Tax=Nocardiopsis alborubida TaxID=146802 RepID=A0A7X6M9J8_9ACTN|nr:NAD(P)H-binding protein [Nocardiopsis alborubida]